MSTEQTVLVAFVVEADTMKQAQELLIAELPKPDDIPQMDSWWIAEDERYDGSDCDSAYFSGTYHTGDREASVHRAMQYLKTYIDWIDS